MGLKTGIVYVKCGAFRVVAHLVLDYFIYIITRLHFSQLADWRSGSAPGS